MKDKTHIISIGREAGKNRHPIWKRRSKIVFADNMILYIENPKEPTKKLSELISKFNKVAGYKMPFTNYFNEKFQFFLNFHQKFKIWLNA